MSTVHGKGTGWARARVGLGIALLLALAATLAGPAAVAGGAGDAEPDAKLSVDVAFARQPADAQRGEPIREQAFASGGEASPVTVAAAVSEASIREAAASLSGPTPPLRRAISAALDGLEVRLALHSADDRLADDDLRGASAVAVLRADGEGGFEGTAKLDELAVAQPVRGAALEAIVDGPGLHVPGQGSHGPYDVELEGASAPSHRFTVWQDVGRCADGPPCTVEVASGMDADSHRGLRAELRSSSSDGFLSMTFTDEDLEPEVGQQAPGPDGEGLPTCSGEPYVGIPGPVLFEATGVDDGPLVATLHIDKAAVQERVDNGRAHYDVCYVGDHPFEGKHGPVDGNGNGAFDGDDLLFGPALLPTCEASSEAVAPCVQARTGEQGGGAKITVLVPAGDPIMR